MQQHVNLVRICEELSNEYSFAKIGVDTAENEPSEILNIGCRPTTDRGPCTCQVCGTLHQRSRVTP